jgi:hypothetical protein
VSLALLVLGAITLPGVPRAEEAVELVDVPADVEALIFRNANCWSMQPGELSATHEPAERPRRGQSRGPATRPVSSSASDARHMPARPASCRSFGKVFLCVKVRILRFRALSGDIATCHSSVGGEFSQCFASLTGSTPPRREWPPCDEWQNLRLTDGLNPDFYILCSRGQSHTSGQQFMGNSLWE